MRIPPPPNIPPATWKDRLLLVWLPLLVAVAVLAVLLVRAEPAGAADKVKVKAGAMLTLSCPGDGIEQGGTVTWFDKRDVSLGTVSGTVVDGTVRFGPAPKKVEYGVAQLDCAAPPTTTSSTTTTVAPTTTSTTTTTTLPPTTTSTTTTTLPPTTTSTTTTTTLPPDPNVYLTGTVTVTDQGYIVYAPAADNIPGAVSCPAGTRLDFAASTFSNPTEVSIQFFPTFQWIIATSIDDPTPGDENVERELSFRIVCVPA
jgi:hypothetical protein